MLHSAFLNFYPGLKNFHDYIKITRNIHIQSNKSFRIHTRMKGKNLISGKGEGRLKFNGE